MIRYPFDPTTLDALPEELADLFRGLELTLLEEIASRLKISGHLNGVTVQDIRALRSHGISLDEIEKAIRETTGISEKKLGELLDDVVERNQRYYSDLITLADVTRPETLVDAAVVDAIRRQTEDTFRNITRSMGFVVDAGRTMLPPAEAYQWALNSAELQIQSGAISYNQAIANATRQLADSGLQYVDYESGWRNHVDVAVRRAVMTGVTQLNAQYAVQSMEYLDTEYVEVSAHAGARDIDGPKGWENHKAWQGKVYRWKGAGGSAGPSGNGETDDGAKSAEIGRGSAIMGASSNSGGADMRETEGANAPIVTNTPARPEKPTYGFKDVTDEWMKNATPNSHAVSDITEFTQDGVTYRVDGRNVKLDYSSHEKEIAELLERKLGGEICMMPRVNGVYKGINTPDYIFRGLRYDLKTIEKMGNDFIYNPIHKKREQADNFVIDVSRVGVNKDAINHQISKIFNYPYTAFVKSIIIIDRDEIAAIFSRG